MKTIKAKIHRLPTEDASQVVRRKDDGLLNNLGRPTKTSLDEWTNQHLYTTTDEEIKEGDWCYQTVINKVIQARTDYYKDFRFRKIIATTDPKLNSNQIEPYDTSKPYGIEFPQIPQDFIKAYCEQGGIDEVLVEVEEIYGEYFGIKGTQDMLSPIGFKLKLNPDNTIIIHPVEEKMYSRDEIGNKIKEFVKEYAYEWSMDDINEWIEENL